MEMRMKPFMLLIRDDNPGATLSKFGLIHDLYTILQVTFYNALLPIGQKDYSANA